MSLMLSCCSCYFTPRLNLSSQHPTKSSSSKPSADLNTQTNLFFSSYAKSKSINQTLQLFQLLPTHDTLTWNTLLASCSTHSQFTTSINLFLQMISSAGSYQPDSLTFKWVLKACFETKNYPLSLQIHAYMTKLYGPCSPDLITNTCLINIYNEFGSTKLARQVFDGIILRDVVAYTSMMVGYNNAGDYEESLNIFQSMVSVHGLTANGFVFTCVLTALAGLSSLIMGEQIHAYIIKASFQSDTFVGTALINMYNKCNRMDCVVKSFAEIARPNVVSWNALIGGNFDGKEVLQLFNRMRESSLSPDHVTFASVLRNCKGISLFYVQQIHGFIMKIMGAELDVYIGGALVDRYTDNGSVADAQKVFYGIHGKDITAFNLAIQGYIRNGHTAEAVNLFHEAVKMGIKPNEATLKSLMIRIGGLNQGKQLHALVIKFGFGEQCDSDGSIATLLIMMYSEFHCLDDAIHLFEEIHSPDLISWTSIISGFSRSGKSQEALKLYKLLLEELDEQPNNFTFSSILCSCASLAAIEEGKQIHCQIIKSNPNIGLDEFVTSGLIEMYSKSGYIVEARRIFDKTSKLDLPTWNSLITNLAQHGYAEKAIEIFQELLNLPNLEPNHITFVGVLSACNHRGLVEEGYRYFKMIEDPTIDHYTCLIDLLGRAGLLDEALNFVKQMPFDPNEVIWSSLLAASALHGNVKVGEFSAKRLLQLNPKDPGTYVALSNIYAVAGRWEDVVMIRKLMKAQSVRKKPGQSWLSVNKTTHIFLAVEG